MKQTSARIGTIIIIIALGIRIALIVAWEYQMDESPRLSLDASSYHQTAQNLVKRQIFTSSLDPPYDPQQPSTFRPPLTPLFLAALYAVFGVNLVWGRLGLAVVGAIACGLTAWLGEQLGGRVVGYLAGSISCIYPLLLLLVILPLTEGLSLFLSVALVALLYASAALAADTPATRYITWSISVGVVFGLALLNKAANIVLLPSILLWAVFQLSGGWTTRLLRVVIILFAATLVILPWTLRNHLSTGAFIPVNSNGGWTLYLGNNAHTAKNLTALEQGTTHGWVPPSEVYEPFQDLSFGDTQRYETRAIKLALTFIWNHPAMALQFAFRKLKIFWSPYPHLADQLSWYPLAGFSLIGIAASLTAWRKHLVVYLLLLSAMSIPVVFTSMPRFRAPIMPFLIIYAALGLLKVGQALGINLEDRRSS
ncbi:hypothetical protein GF339_12130 [candidate division KSB3 bacterium]|uniref:Glycosyltransferase RgtA/B/C/D-like domain-containing protein n=1 Tax=candidate division KSB3 bacterium TaxID=2044937 RepID=A0A9D5JW39_9BACT|nr:hypothetical protein [candidate division KSB3 bacterium]MBD3325328.1 hypothetical protein [candidate division KSB3 bacterium]